MNRTTLSRRDLFSRLFRLREEVPSQLQPAATKVPQVAIVQGRFCLAYQKSFCSVCVERCPVEGAITMENNLPRVNPQLCNGCGICHQLCPAPRNGILMLARERVPSFS